VGHVKTLNKLTMDFLLLALGLQLLMLISLFLVGYSFSTFPKANSLATLTAWIRQVWRELCLFRDWTGNARLIQIGTGRPEVIELSTCSPINPALTSYSETCLDCEDRGGMTEATSPSDSYLSKDYPFKRVVNASWAFLIRILWKRSGRSVGKRRCHHPRPSNISFAPKASDATTCTPIRRSSIADPSNVNDKARPLLPRSVLIHPDLSPVIRAVLARKLLSLDRRIKSRRHVSMLSPIFEIPTAEEGVWA
jgi:hypothetical protein